MIGQLSPDELSEIEPWLDMCGYCDGGPGMDCTHPAGDYRVPMSRLLHHADALAAERDTLRAVVDADVDMADAWAALGVVAAVTKTRLTPREETALAELQDAARQRVVLTTKAHAQALAQWRKENQQ